MYHGKATKNQMGNNIRVYLNSRATRCNVCVYNSNLYNDIIECRYNTVHDISYSTALTEAEYKSVSIHKLPLPPIYGVSYEV